MISAELLKEVLGMYATPYDIEQKDSKLLFTWDNSSGSANTDVNIYQLAHMCKEWANDLSPKRYQLYSCIAPQRLSYSTCTIYSGAIQQTGEISADTEQESIFKACQWILEKLK